MTTFAEVLGELMAADTGHDQQVMVEQQRLVLLRLDAQVTDVDKQLTADEVAGLRREWPRFKALCVHKAQTMDESERRWADQLHAEAIGNTVMHRAGLATDVTADDVYLGWAEDWVAGGAPTLQMPERFAAALMATEIPDSFVTAPWPVFMIRVPPRVVDAVDFLGVHRIDADPTHVVWQFVAFGRDTESTHAWFFSTGDDVRHNADPSKYGTCVSRLENATESEFGSSADETPRWQVVLMRLALGSCAWTTRHRPVLAGKPRVGPRAKPRTANEAMSSRGLAVDYVIGKPVTVDCRDTLRHYLSGAPSAPKAVRWLVRGHWRNQACGAAHSDRRLTWIEPHWKGDADAAVLVRPHEIGRANR